MRTLVFAAVAAFIGSTALVSAQTMPAGPAAAQRHVGRHHVTANGRCDGVSYGTGARRCNSMTGGPSGGLSSKN